MKKVLYNSEEEHLIILFHFLKKQQEYSGQ
jgi:hypothetical protein